MAYTPTPSRGARSRVGAVRERTAGHAPHYKNPTQVLALYQALQSEVQQLQQRSYAPPPPLNAGFAYRVRDSDVNVSGGFSQGRGQLQVSAVDDDTLMEGDPALVTAPSHGHVGMSVVL